MSCCALRRKDSLFVLARRLAERVGQGEVGGVTRRMLCTWQLLGLVVKGSWLAPGGPIPTLVASKHYPHLSGGSFLAENAF